MNGSCHGSPIAKKLVKKIRTSYFHMVKVINNMTWTIYLTSLSRKEMQASQTTQDSGRGLFTVSVSTVICKCPPSPPPHHSPLDLDSNISFVSKYIFLLSTETGKLPHKCQILLPDQKYWQYCWLPCDIQITEDRRVPTL